MILVLKSQGTFFYNFFFLFLSVFFLLLYNFPLLTLISVMWIVRKKRAHAHTNKPNPVELVPAYVTLDMFLSFVYAFLIIHGQFKVCFDVRYAPTILCYECWSFAARKIMLSLGETASVVILTILMCKMFSEIAFFFSPWLILGSLSTYFFFIFRSFAFEFFIQFAMLFFYVCYASI